MSMRLQNYLLSAMVLLALMTTSCMSDMDMVGDTLTPEQDQSIQDYLDSTGIDATKSATGIYYQVLEQNRQGTPVKDGDIVYAHYVLRTLSGRLIDSLDSSVDSLSTIRFYQDAQTVVPQGFYMCADLMNVGEKFRIFMPSSRAYGSFSYKTLITTNEIIVADLEVVAVESLDEQLVRESTLIEEYLLENELADSVEHLASGIYFQRLASTEGAQPKSGDMVQLNYKGMLLNGTTFDESSSNNPLNFTLNNSNIIKGFEEGVKQMREGEKARIILPSELAYSYSFAVFPEVVRESFLKQAFSRTPFEPFTPVIFELELLNVE